MCTSSLPPQPSRTGAHTCAALPCTAQSWAMQPSGQGHGSQVGQGALKGCRSRAQRPSCPGLPRAGARQSCVLQQEEPDRESA